MDAVAFSRPLALCATTFSIPADFHCQFDIQLVTFSDLTACRQEPILSLVTISPVPFPLITSTAAEETDTGSKAKEFTCRSTGYMF